MDCIKQNAVRQWTFCSERICREPSTDVEVDFIFSGPDGEKVVPAFWAGDNNWCVRFSSPVIGEFSYRSVCSDEANSDLHGLEGKFSVLPYDETNPLLVHGPIEASADNRHFQHRDGTPFFWLGDTWWMGLCKRLDWPETFQALAQDRAAKGFNVVQIVAGLYPDMGPFDERGANEAGFPWEADFARVNSNYFDMVDRRIEYLVNLGIVPCIVGCWGYYLDFMGADKIKEHWRYLIARYGAYPVIWCLAGEAIMPYYLSEEFSNRNGYEARAKREWTEIGRHVRSLDAFRRLLTIHSVIYRYDMVEDNTILDLLLLQTGHGSHQSLHTTVKGVREALDVEPRMPVLVGEACYEGICEGSREEVQRYIFWASILSGAAGHTYGADGVWQVNRKEMPYGPSPTGTAWGEATFEAAYKLPGSRQLGIAKKLLERYPWWELEPHQEWTEIGPDAGVYAEEVRHYHVPYAAGIPGKLRLIYFGVWMAQLQRIKSIEPDAQYRAYLFNPGDGSEFDLGVVEPDSAGDWKLPVVPVCRDWVLVMEAENE